MPKCDQCPETEEDKFYWLPSVKRYSNYCKECAKTSAMLNYQKNREDRIAKRLKWQEENRELHNSHVRSYYQRNKKKAVS